MTADNARQTTLRIILCGEQQKLTRRRRLHVQLALREPYRLTNLNSARSTSWTLFFIRHQNYLRIKRLIASTPPWSSRRAGREWLRLWNFTWIFPTLHVESIRLATFTALPQMSYCGLLAPITPATTGPMLMPWKRKQNIGMKQRWEKCSSVSRLTNSKLEVVEWMLIDVSQLLLNSESVLCHGCHVTEMNWVWRVSRQAWRTSKKILVRWETRGDIWK